MAGRTPKAVGSIHSPLAPHLSIAVGQGTVEARIDAGGDWIATRNTVDRLGSWGGLPASPWCLSGKQNGQAKSPTAILGQAPFLWCGRLGCKCRRDACTTNSIMSRAAEASHFGAGVGRQRWSTSSRVIMRFEPSFSTTYCRPEVRSRTGVPGGRMGAKSSGDSFSLIA